MNKIFIIVIILLTLYLINNQVDSFGPYSAPSPSGGFGAGCDSCTLESPTKPPFSAQPALLPHPRYEFSYYPEEWNCTKGFKYNPYNGCQFNNKNHTYNPLQLKSSHKLYGIMPDNQLFHVRNRLAPNKSQIYTSSIFSTPTQPNL